MPMSAGRSKIGLGCSLERFVNTFSQFLAGLEVRDILRGDGHRYAAHRVAPCPCRAVVQGEAAEAADFDSVAFRQGTSHGVEDGLDRDFRIFDDKSGKAGSDGGDEIGACHSVLLYLLVMLGPSSMRSDAEARYHR